LRKRQRWAVETLFLDSKQYAGLSACQWWVDQAMVHHVALVLLTFVIRIAKDDSMPVIRRW
jgi:hypothetical protein